MRMYADFAVRCFRIYLCMLPLATANKGTFIYLQALGKAGISSSVSLMREIVLGCGLPILLPLAFGLNGVLYSMPVSDLLTFAVVAVLIARTMKELSSR